jgi:hypothetical protein
MRCAPEQPRGQQVEPAQGLIAACIGNAVEWYDTFLVARTGNPLVPAYYASAVALLAAIGVLMIGETAFHPLDTDHR